ncbi:MAG: hypothetical protein E6R03_01280 [Hyphomicrobiaceae bacterium]|nr:MAG: hypothetical protein E6R03_01280 [Hyphomicrobiaceae bacterium]
MKAISESAKVALLTIIAVASLLHLRLAYDSRDQNISDQLDAVRARNTLVEFYNLSDSYDLARTSWILQRKNAGGTSAIRGTTEWKIQAAEFKLTKSGSEMAKKMRELRSEYQDLTWRHPTWSFMYAATPDLKYALGED